MAQESSGLLNKAQGLAYKVENALNSIPSSSKKGDTKWHDEMVKRANKSFTGDEKRKVSSETHKRSVTQKKYAPKKAVKKVATKR